MADFSETSPYKSDVLQGTVAVVTGGGSGIGFVIAQQLGLHGAKLVIMGRREQMLQQAVSRLTEQGVDAALMQGDVRDTDSCASVCNFASERYGGLTMLVNCAAGNFMSLSEDLSSNAYKTVLDIDTLGTFNMCQAAFPFLKQAKNANIVNITVNSKWREGRTWYQMHAASAKAAITTMATTQALEWGVHGIRVNCVGPGFIDDTPALAKMANDDLKQMMCRAVPLGRLGKRFEIAMAVLFCSVSPYVTGETVVVDGGEWLYPGEPLVPREMMSALANSRKAKL